MCWAVLEFRQCTLGYNIHGGLWHRWLVRSFLLPSLFFCIIEFVNDKQADSHLSLAIDMILLICVAVVLKDRKEKERYRLIDAKVGVSAI